MRELRLVGPGPDPNQVIVESVDGEEQFRLNLGDDLRISTRPETEAPAATAVRRPRAVLGPAEIQRRVRSGESPETIAVETGVDIEKVQRFAGAVIEERTRMAGEARRARARGSRVGGSVVTFGDAVDAHFSAIDVDPDEVRWDAYRRDDGQWLVTAAWSQDDAERTARWTFSLTSRLVTPVDSPAADLLTEPQPRPRPAVELVPEPDEIPFTETGPLSGVVDELFDQHALEELAAEPPLPFGEPVHVVAAAAPSRQQNGRGGRATVPAWDDIMLGVRRSE